MGAVAWKLGTLAGAAASIFFAFHPVRGAPAHAIVAATAVPARSTPATFAAWLVGGTPATTASAPLVAKLRAAATPEDVCAALGELGEAGDEDATQAILGTLQSSKRSQIRTCATDALGHVTSGESRSWLEELAGDRDADVRGAAMRALASSQDESARGVVLALARDGSSAQRVVAMVALAEAKVTSVTPLIVAALPTVDAATRSELLEALGASGDPGAVAAVAAAAQNGSQSARLSAIEALGAIGGDASVGALAALLRTGRRDTVGITTKALAQANTPAARRALFDAVAGSRRDVASAALDALSSLDGPEVRAAMVGALGGSDRDGAALAAQWFGEQRDEAAVPALVELARHSGAQAEENAISALAQIGGDAARDAIVDLAGRAGPAQALAIGQLGAVTGDPAVARTICVKLARDESATASGAALDALGGDPSPEARDALLDAARGGGAASARALSVLAKRGDEASLLAVADVARGGAGDVRLHALEALGESGDPRATEALVRALKENDPDVRRAALTSLASVGGEEAQRAISDMATTGPRDARLAATQSLVQLGADAAEPLEKLAHDTDAEVARTALVGLAGEAPDRAARVVADVATTGDPGARLAAIETAAQLESSDASPILVAALHDPDANVTQTAATELGRLGTPEADAALVELLTRSNAPYEGQRAAADAIASEGGELAARYADVIGRLQAMPAPASEQGDDDLDVRTITIR